MKNLKSPIKIAEFNTLQEKTPAYAKALNTDLVIIKYDDNVSVLYGRCLHRGALLSDGYIDGNNLICGLHFWDYRYDSGISEYNPAETLHKFKSVVENNSVYIDEDEVKEFEVKLPSRFNSGEYLGEHIDTHPEDTEPYTNYIKQLAQNGLSKTGHHGPSAAMGVDRNTLPKWENIQILPAQFAKKPLMDEDEVNTKVIIGKKARKPLELKMPVFISDMSFGALSKEAKISLAKGAEMAGTGICSGEGGMLPEEKENNSRYFYELASAEFGFSWDKLKNIQAFHFKGGQGAKVGTGGHLPGNKVSEEIAKVRGLPVGKTAISPPTFKNLNTVEDFKNFANKVREVSNGVPIGFKLAASHIEDDIDFALQAGADYIILDGRGGGTGAAPTVLRDNICVPTIPALARARKYLDEKGAKDVSLIITGGLRIAEDFTKALALGADAVAIANSAIQAVGCLGMRACNTNNCPVGIATQKEHLRGRLNIDKSATQLYNFLTASNSLIKVLARACGYDDISNFNLNDLTTFHFETHKLTGIPYAGVS
ncbi:MAG TPA: glutamate synthase [Ignavibacteria bacterium]|nr:glutamate synthase [Ignavibacteria bacterium]